MPLSDDPRSLTEAVQRDVMAAFGTAFPGEFSVPDPFADDAPIASGDVAVVPWRWTGTHEAKFHGLRPTGQPVDFTGVTILRAEGDGMVFHRQVDWLALYTQIDAVVAARRH
jgi:predicted ester cyclase